MCMEDSIDKFAKTVQDHTNQTCVIDDDLRNCYSL